MKKLIILMVILSSCVRVQYNQNLIKGRVKHTKSLRQTRQNLRINYHYHQTKLGTFFNFEV
jgi:hypothetical protein